FHPHNRLKADLSGLLFFWHSPSCLLASQLKLRGVLRLILPEDSLFSNLNPKTNPLMIRILLPLILFPFLAFGQSKTDTIELRSAAMNKSLKTAITTPSSYRADKQNYHVLYLLH